MVFAQKILELRTRLHLSQEELAERIGVSRKTIQNWENGSSMPDGENLLTISKKFDVSVDTLLSGENKRCVEEHFDKFFPTRNRFVWECYEKDLAIELQQCEEEGRDIAAYKNLIHEISAMPAGKYKEKFADVLFEMIMNTKTVAGYEYDEPSTLCEILERLPEVKKVAYDKSIIREKVKGAWLGRICGCLLGKPIEGYRTNVTVPLLKATNNYPMTKYIAYADIEKYTEEGSPLRLPKEGTWIDKIDYAPSDDDTNYSVLSSMIIDEWGRNFAPDNVLDAWLKYFPKDACCTAERVAWKNYFNGYQSPITAIYKNPYREYIGAQIRVDYYGYVNPGNVKEAIRMAFNDASVSHVKNGIYGAMFVAAMISYAAVCSDTLEVIKTGISQVPATSRLYAEVNKIIDMYLAGKSQEDCREYIRSRYDEYTDYGWCHAIPNCMIVTMGLLYHQNDYGKSICAAVEMGYDTDCNGATIGSIFGMMHGAQAIPSVWTDPIHGKLRTSIFGYELVDIEKLVEKTLSHIE